jgi:hypothetical protein
MSSRSTTRVVARLLFAVALALAVLAPASAAFANAPRDNYPPTTPTTKVTVKGTSSSDPATLPFTGGNALLLAVIGVSVLGGGVLLVMASRRRSRSTA